MDLVFTDVKVHEERVNATLGVKPTIFYLMSKKCNAQNKREKSLQV